MEMVMVSGYFEDNPFEVAEIINMAAASAPNFDDKNIIGIPIYALLLYYLQLLGAKISLLKRPSTNFSRDIFDYYSNYMSRKAVNQTFLILRIFSLRFILKRLHPWLLEKRIKGLLYGSQD